MRIGIDSVDAAATGPLQIAEGLERGSYPRVTFAEVASRTEGEVVLDVRRDDERANGLIEGSVHIA